jgi:predicted helicase
MPPGESENCVRWGRSWRQIGDEHTTAIGDAFEIFFEAFLATQPIMQADRRWLVKRVDPDLRRLLNLPADAKGIDGVYRQRTGDYTPYQVKFRSGRGTLSFTEVAPFLGVTERSAQVARLIVTNANELQTTSRLASASSVARASWFTVTSWPARPHTPPSREVSEQRFLKVVSKP